MEPWRRVWREFLSPRLTYDGLRALYVALQNDDNRLLQGATTTPPPLFCVQDWPVEAADAICFAFWADAEFEATVGEAEEFFARTCFDIDQDMGEPAGCRHWLNFWDDMPRKELFRLVLAEVERTLEYRRGINCHRSTAAPLTFTDYDQDDVVVHSAEGDP